MGGEPPCPAQAARATHRRRASVAAALGVAAVPAEKKEHATTAHAAAAVAPKFFFYREFLGAAAMADAVRARCAATHARHANYPPPRAPKRLSRTNIDEGGAIAEILAARGSPAAVLGEAPPPAAPADPLAAAAAARSPGRAPGDPLGAAAAARASP